MILNLDEATNDPREMRELAQYLYNMSRYARYKASAMNAHGAGWKRLAETFENYCDGVYNELPQKWRW
jgi:hypothetical protein